MRKELKPKWKYLKDYYKRVIKQGKSGDPAHKKKKKFIYEASLAFLQTAQARRRTVGNLADSPDASDVGSEIDEPEADQPSGMDDSQPNSYRL